MLLTWLAWYEDLIPYRGIILFYLHVSQTKCSDRFYQLCLKGRHFPIWRFLSPGQKAVIFFLVSDIKIMTPCRQRLSGLKIYKRLRLSYFWGSLAMTNTLVYVVLTLAYLCIASWNLGEKGNSVDMQLMLLWHKW